MNGKLTATLSARGRLKATLSKAIERVEPIIKPLEITENGNYSATENVHGFNPVNVNVPLKYEEGYTDGYQASQDSITLQEKTITENGEYETDEGFTGMSKVTVAVPIKEEQEKTVEITKNGTTEVVADEGKSMSKVTVNTNVAFEGDIGKPLIDTSKMTSFQYFFNGGANLELLNNIDTSNGTDFSYMFSNCGSLTTIPQLYTAKSTSFTSMFFNCKNLVSVPQFETSKSKSFTQMFYGCTSVKELPSFDFSAVTTSNNINYMLNSCSKLETISLKNLKVNTRATLFQDCTALKNITIGEGWAVNIYLHYSNELTVESLHGMIENLADLTGQTAKTFQIGATNLAKIDEEHINMLKAKNWNYS